MEEAWRDIPGWEGLYQASSQGRIRSVTRTVVALRHGRMAKATYTGKIMALTPRGVRGKYLGVNLSRGDVKRSYMVHRLICHTFHGDPLPGQEAAHNDGNSFNNQAKNLRWATVYENAADKARHGTQRRGVDASKAKLTEQQVCEIRRRKVSGERARTLAEAFGINPQTVHDIVARRSWAHVP